MKKSSIQIVALLVIGSAILSSCSKEIVRGGPAYRQGQNTNKALYQAPVSRGVGK